ncbi:diguanylate cyclase [Alcaligenaceae bacterium CGII-47]|nr:diguanylate cyclase [Alcaligenaceae bacterium CGII-47]
MNSSWTITYSREQNRLSVQARVIAQNMGLHLVSGKLTLKTMVGEVSNLDWDVRTPFMSAIANALPGVSAMGMLDEHGNLLVSNRDAYVGMNLGGRNYFQRVKSQPVADMLYVSRPYQSTEGIYSINLSRAVLGRDGEFHGLVYAALDNQYFETLMQSVLYAPDMWASLLHSDGPLFLSRPDHQNIAGSDMSQVAGATLSQGDTLFSRHQTSGELVSTQHGLTRGRSGDQIIVFNTVYDSSLDMDKTLVVAVGRNIDQVFTIWRRRTLAQGLLFGLIALLSTTALAIFQRRQRVFDIKAREAYRALRAKDQDYRLIVDGTKDLVFKLDKNGCFTYSNPAFCALFGLMPSDLIGQRCDDHPALIKQCMDDAILRQLAIPPFTAHYSRSSDTTQGLSHIDWHAQALIDEDGAVSGIVSIGHNVTEHIVLTNTLQEQAQRDPLTGLANRRYLLERGQTEQVRAHRYKRPLSALMLDLDHFKRVNDTYGHKMGDVVLQTLSALLLAHKREPDIAARYGGEEFVVLLPDTDLTAALQIGERLRKLVEQSAVVTDTGETIRYTTSVGVAQMGGEVMTLECLLGRADQALYQAKRTGRNKVCTVDIIVDESACRNDIDDA